MTQKLRIIHCGKGLVGRQIECSFEPRIGQLGPASSFAPWSRLPLRDRDSAGGPILGQGKPVARCLIRQPGRAEKSDSLRDPADVGIDRGEDVHSEDA